MNNKSQNDKATSPDSREARLKQALKANLARRKAQSRARATQDSDKPDKRSEQ